MPIADLKTATMATIEQEPLVVDLTKPVQFVGRRDEQGVQHLTFTGQTTTGNLVTVPEFAITEVIAAIAAEQGAPAAAAFQTAAADVFATIRAFALSKVGATAGAPP